jgi:hypothetical protein
MSALRRIRDAATTGRRKRPYSSEEWRNFSRQQYIWRVAMDQVRASFSGRMHKSPADRSAAGRVGAVPPSLSSGPGRFPDIRTQRVNIPHR